MAEHLRKLGLEGPTLTASPAVVTVGTIHGRTRANIVPESVRMTGIIRSYDTQVREQVQRDIRMTTEKIAESAGAKADVSIFKNYDPVVNDKELTSRMFPVLFELGAVAREKIPVEAVSRRPADCRCKFPQGPNRSPPIC